MTGRHVVVTGAAGAVGSAVARALVNVGMPVIATDRVPFECAGAAGTPTGDLQDVDFVRTLLGDTDRVVHLGAIPSPRGYPDEVIFGSNTLGTFTLLDEAGRAGVDRAIVASSAAALGLAWAEVPTVPLYLPVDEGHPCQLSDPYGLSKQVAEAAGAMVHRRFGLNSIFFRFPFIGSGDRLTAHLDAFAHDPDLARRELWGWIHLDDAVEGIHAALVEEWTGHHVLTLAAVDSGSAHPSADLIAEHFPGTPMRRPLTAHESLFDSARATALVNFTATRSWRHPDSRPDDSAPPRSPPERSIRRPH